MAKKFSPPALQHLARSAHDTPEQVEKALIESYISRPPFTYKFLDRLILTLMKGGRFSREQLDAAIRAHQKVERYQRALLEISPLIHAHFNQRKPQFIVEVPTQSYRINKLEIPFRPPFAFGTDSGLVIPWFIYWKINPLTDKQLSLLVTLICELQRQDPDFSEAKLLLYDFSAGDRLSDRTLKVVDAASIPKLPDAARDQMLGNFLEGYARALARIPTLKARTVIASSSRSPQVDLFDDTVE